MSPSDVVAPLAGGMLIGLAALVLYATLGRIAGVSGIAFGSLWADAGDRAWRWTFLAGLVGGGWLAAAFIGPLATPALDRAALGIAIAAGLLVGFGTRLGGGCTSGHGVCGLARRSPRSLVAVAVFIAIGIVTATLLRPLLA